ncbi:MAG TPA: hypothetical protein VJP07_09800 [Dehalococcoidia bacterium]|nr:hypothetical protein [Dehalococcoidia bacterium]
MVTRRTQTRKPAAPREARTKKGSLSLFERLAAIGEAIPDEVIAKLPKDLARNFDHYAHGSPRQD